MSLYILFFIKCKYTEEFFSLVKNKSKGMNDLLEIIMKKTNVDYDAFCEALHETKQTYLVHNFMVAESKLEPFLLFFCELLIDYYV